MASARPGPSMAARCTACSTVFRVVADQLRVSEGWVRCGRCAEVFNAAENLIDLDTGAPRRMPEAAQVQADEAPKPATPVQARASRSPVQMMPVPARVEQPLEPWPERPRERPFEPPQGSASESRFDTPPAVSNTPNTPSTPNTHLTPQAPPPTHQDTLPWPEAETDPGPLASTVADSAADSTTKGVADTRADSAADTVLENPEHARLMADTEFLDDAQQATPWSAAAEAEVASPLRPQADDAATETKPLPSFVRRADRAARWRQPKVRAALGLTAGLLAAVLGAQVTYIYRDLVAARWPLAGSVLRTACPWLGCSVGPARAIDSLSVESSGLVRVEKSNVYRLSLALRNRSGIELALPALDLSLTDAQGQLILRRVLRTSELGAAQPTLPAGRELALQATLQTANLSTAAALAAGAGGGVAGYTIELFYP